MRMIDNDDLFEAPEQVSVLLPLPLDRAYDYLADADMGLKRGDLVVVPLGRQERTGVVLGPGSEDLARERMKAVIRRHDAPPLPEIVLDLVEWVARYTLSPAGQVLRMAISVPAALVPPKPVIAYAGLPEEVVPSGLRLTPARRRVLDLLRDGPPMMVPDIVREAGAGAAVIKGLAGAGAIATVQLPADVPPPVPDHDHLGPDLSASQLEAATSLKDQLARGEFAVTLLDGVTGSGKTEVYFEAVAEALRRGRQVLVLLPEIALSAQWLERFVTRFGVLPVEWHSDLNPRGRRRIWRAIAEGRARVVVGARSALFLPFPELGLIVVDEEHDPGFKQDEGVSYHARDMAVVRAQLAGHPIILASATPSLESVTNVERGRYQIARLPSRHGGATLPEVRAIDLRQDGPGRGLWMAPALVASVQAALERQEQALLFLNRRGYAPLTLCRTCGHRLECPNCSAWLVEHRFSRRLQCHHCGFSTRTPEDCPECDASGSLAASGPGVERLAEEIATLFPDARTTLMSSDTVHGPAAAAEFVRSVREGEVDLIIGTQIVAKGYDFPRLTVVGVIDADLGLAGGDLRAGERTYQLLQQVAGRAGRAERPGVVWLQTHDPDNPVIRAMVAGDRDGFLAAEIDARRAASMPPFGRLVAIILSGHDEKAVDATARELARTAPRGPGVAVLGPAPAPLALLRGRHRRRLLVKAGRGVATQPLIAGWISAIKVPSSVRLSVDIDPYNFM
jgi:primosomal protein N' (replication factor Y)